MTELQNDRMTDSKKTICPPIFDLGGIKTCDDVLGEMNQQCLKFVINFFRKENYLL